MICFLYYVPLKMEESGSWLETEVLANFETEESINYLISHLQQRVPEIVPVNLANKDWMETISEYRVFNYTYAFGRLADSIAPCYFLETRGSVYFGATPIGILLSSNKPHASSLMRSLGYLTPKEYLIVSEISEKDAERLCRLLSPVKQLVLKPAYEESSIALRLIENEPTSIFDSVNNIYNSLLGPLILQEYVEGEDVTVPVIGRKKAVPLPAVVLKHNQGNAQAPFVFEATSKATKTDVHYESMGNYPIKIRKEAYKMAVDAFHITQQRDYARLDFRLTEDGACYFLEMNANPQLGLDKASFAVSSAAIDLEVCDVFEMIINDCPKFENLYFFKEGL